MPDAKVPGVKCQLPGFRSRYAGSRCKVLGVQVSGVQVPGVKCQVLGSRCEGPGSHGLFVRFQGSDVTSKCLTIYKNYKLILHLNGNYKFKKTFFYHAKTFSLCSCLNCL